MATALVILMTIPGLALFYGGLVRSKNMLSVLMQVFMVFSLISVLWVVYGYSLAFTREQSLLRHARQAVPEGRDAGIGRGDLQQGRGPAGVHLHRLPGHVRGHHRRLIVGAFAERIKFSAVLLFCVLWFTFAYLPIAHMVWYWDGPDAITDAKTLATVTANAGFMWAKGALDFAGGTVVHINAAIAGLVGAYVLGKRVGYGKEVDGAAQPDADDGRRLAAVGGLVRLQRRLQPRSQRHRGPGLHQHRSSPRPLPTLAWCRG